VKILVLHPGALGDIILSLPALAALRRRFPGSDITFAANLDFSKAAVSGYADRLISFSSVPLHTLFGTAPDLPFWSAYDRILSWTGAGKSEFEAGLKRIPAEVLIGRWKPDPGNLSHVAINFLESIMPWVGKTDLHQPKISASLDDIDAAARKLTAAGWDGSPIVALHPGAGSKAKRWSLPRFHGLAQRILHTGASLMIVEGPAEVEIGSELDLQGARVFRCRQFGLVPQKGYLAHCQAFVGNDSGIAHLAAAMGIPSVVLFGPTLPENWAPLGERVVTIRKASGSLADISSVEVFSALLSLSKNNHSRC
jgi:heptosyltransferase III